MILPWVLAAGAFAFYAATLNHWVSFGSLGLVARVSGWMWQPELLGSLTWVITYPLRWLPASQIPLALNLLAAACGALTLGLLARSVVLLPRDRTQEQRDRERSAFSLLSGRHAWLPPVLAVLVCGLQLSFWENATAPGGAACDMLDLLAFAYVIRCLLEFRIDERERWLVKASLVCGFAMASNWGAIGFLPLYLAALVWLKGLSFFNPRFLGRMAVWGLAGLLLYLFLPLVQSRADIAPVPFWQALKMNLATQKTALASIPFNKVVLAHGILGDERPLWILALWSLLPLLVMAIRWPSYFGDPSPMGVNLTNLVFHVFHALVLVVCLWVALDPAFSPRHFGVGLLALLPFYYLGALSVGYYSGYFALVFQPKKTSRALAMPRPQSALGRLLNFVAICGLYILVLLAPALLLRRNFPQIRITNGPMLKQYASLQIQSLPPKGAVLLSDDPRRSLLLEAALAQSGQDKSFIFIQTPSLKIPEYHRFLKKKYGRRWPGEPPKDRQRPVEDGDLLELVMALERTNAVFYLHPSFGYYFEQFYAEPQRLVYQLKLYPTTTNSLLAPSLSEQSVAANEAFWDKLDNDVLEKIQADSAPAGPPSAHNFLDPLLERAYLRPERNGEATAVAGFYSQGLNDWGVKLQQSGKLKEAALRFRRAHDLNPDNVVALANLEFNKDLQSGRTIKIRMFTSPEDELANLGGKYHTLQQAMKDNGPFDEPSFCYEQGKEFARGNNSRQAAQWFDRVKVLAPEDFSARLLLAYFYVTHQMSSEAIRIIQELHAEEAKLGLTSTNVADLMRVEAYARFNTGDVPGAQAAVNSVLRKFPQNPYTLRVAAEVYIRHQVYSNVLDVVEQQIKQDPGNVDALVNKGFAYLQLGDYPAAIQPLTRALELETNTASIWFTSALLNRAIAYLKTGKLDEAQRDFQALQDNAVQHNDPTSFKWCYQLGDIAYRKKDTNAAVRSFQLFLTNGAPEADLAKQAAARLKELQAGIH